MNNTTRARRSERRIKVSRMNNLNSNSKSWKWDPAHWHGEEQSILGGQLHQIFFFRWFFFLCGVKAPRFMLAFVVVHWLLHFCALKKILLALACRPPSLCLPKLTSASPEITKTHTALTRALLPRPLAPVWQCYNERKVKVEMSTKQNIF